MSDAAVSPVVQGAFLDAMTQRSTALIIEGPAGIGKSRLLGETRQL